MKPNQKISRWLLLPLLCFFGIGALYLLSIGPAVFIWEKFDLSDEGPLADVVFALYGPLERIPEDSPMKKALNLYVRLWEPKGSTK